MYRVILIASLFYFTNAYNIFFYRGSFVDKSMYAYFIKNLQRRLPESTIQFQDYIRTSDFPKNSILIGHSFGGFVSLLHTMDHPENVKACILLNSHFNHVNQMPYLRVPIDKVKQPTLCIFTNLDEQLPCKKVFQDWDIAIEKHIENKEFELYDGSHFSIFTKPDSSKMASDNIANFISRL